VSRGTDMPPNLALADFCTELLSLSHETSTPSDLVRPFIDGAVEQQMSGKGH